MLDVMVTGANGYIGKHVVSALVNKGYKVIAVDIVDSGIDKRAEFVKASIFDDIALVEELVAKIDVCIHMAWRNGFVHNADSHIEELWGHYNFFTTLTPRKESSAVYTEVFIFP